MAKTITTLEQFSKTFLTERVLCWGINLNTRIVDMGNGYYAELMQERGKENGRVGLSIKEMNKNGAGMELVDAGYSKRSCGNLEELTSHLETLAAMKPTALADEPVRDSDFRPISYRAIKIGLGLKYEETPQKPLPTYEQKGQGYYFRVLRALDPQQG